MKRGAGGLVTVPNIGDWPPETNSWVCSRQHIAAIKKGGFHIQTACFHEQIFITFEHTKAVLYARTADLGTSIASLSTIMVVLYTEF